MKKQYIKCISLKNYSQRFSFNAIFLLFQVGEFHQLIDRNVAQIKRVSTCNVIFSTIQFD